MKTFVARATLEQLRLFAFTCWMAGPLPKTVTGSFVYLAMCTEDKKRGLVDLQGQWLSNAPKPLVSARLDRSCEGFPPSLESGFGWESKAGDRLTAIPVPGDFVQNYNIRCTPANGETCQYMLALAGLGVRWAEASEPQTV